MNPANSQTTLVALPSSESIVAPSTLGDIWSEFHHELWKFIRPRVGSDSACDDLLQTAFLRATRTLERGTRVEQPRAWLHQIARNLIIDSYRTESRRRALETPLGTDDLLKAVDEESCADENMSNVIAGLLPRFVDLLDEPYRTAVRLIDLQGSTVQGAAELEQVSLSCMKARVRRGRRQLLDALERCCTFEIDGRGLPISCTPRSLKACDACG